MLNKNRKPILSILIVGITSMVFQIIIIREFLSVFYGNELVLGIIIANWMLLTGVGAYLGRYTVRIKNKMLFMSYLQIFIAVLPCVSVFLLRILRNYLFPVGASFSILHTTYGSLIIMLPYCICSGMFFTIFAGIISENEKNRIGKAYYLDTIGMVVGGLLFNFILIYILTTFQILVFLMLINFSSFIYFFDAKKIIRIAFTIIFLLELYISFDLVDMDKYTESKLYSGQEIIINKETPYGKIVVTKTADQLNFFENGCLLSSTYNIQEREEDAHYAMVQHPNPKSVLIISGGINGIFEEVLKYKPKRIDYVEINPLVIELCKKNSHGFDDNRINIIEGDARFFIKETKNKYDVVLINIPEPATAQLNRFYTLEFYQELKKKLNNGAVISSAASATTNYISAEALELQSVIYNTLKAVFQNVVIFPTSKNYYIASDSNIAINIIPLIEKREIDNIYINKYYFDEFSIRQKSQLIQNSIDKYSNVNTDLKPIAYSNQFQYWLSYYEINYMLILGVLMLPLLLILIRSDSVGIGLFTAGFAATSSEIVILIVFQIIYGYVYQYIGLIITLFMAGLAIGAYYGGLSKIKKNINIFIILGLLITGYLFFLSLIIPVMQAIAEYKVFAYFIFLLLILLISFIIGMEFSIASKLVIIKYNKRGIIANNYSNNVMIFNKAASVYTIDLFGSALAGLLVSALLIPKFGICGVCIISGVFMLIANGIVFINRRKY